MMLLKCCKQYASKFGKFSSGNRTGKVQFSFQSQRQAITMSKLLHDYAHFICQEGNVQNPSRQASAVHGLRTSRCMSWIQKRQRNQRSIGQHSLDHRKSKEILGKKSTSASLTILKLLTVWITTNCGKFLKRWEYQTTLPASCETCMQVKKQQLVPDMEQWTGSKLGMVYIKAVYCHSAYLTYMQGFLGGANGKEPISK